MSQAVTPSYLKRRDEGWNAMVAAAQAAWHSPPEVIAAAVRRATGAILARMHTIPTNGYGHLDGAGHGRWPTWDVFLLEFLEDPALRERLQQLRRTAPSGGVVASAIDGAVRLLRERREVLRAQPARLVHHDYEPWHIFADATPGKEHITGVIDHESCRGGDPAYDLAQWHVIHDAYAPVAPVLDGYRAAGGWTDAFETRLHLSLVHFRLKKLLETLAGQGDQAADDTDVATRAQRLATELGHTPPGVSTR